jgi:hypothetical protein
MRYAKSYAATNSWENPPLLALFHECVAQLADNPPLLALFHECVAQLADNPPLLALFHECVAQLAERIVKFTFAVVPFFEAQYTRDILHRAKTITSKEKIFFMFFSRKNKRHFCIYTSHMYIVFYSENVRQYFSTAGYLCIRYC